MSKIKIKYHQVRDPSVLNGQTLQSRIQAALDRETGGTPVKRSWRTREWADDISDPPRNILANHIRPGKGNIFGDLVSFNPAITDRVLSREEETAEEADTPRLDIGNNKSLIRNHAYWLSAGNHFLYCSSGLSISAAERYFSWLLQSYAGLDENSKLRLTAAVRVREEDLRTMREITIGDDLVVHPGPKTEKLRKKLIKKGLSAEEDDPSRLRKLLEGLLGEPEQVDRVLMEIPPDQKVAWSFTLKFLRTRPETSRAALMDAHALVADLDDAPNIKLQTANGTVRGEDLTLVREIDVREDPPGLPDRTQILDEMQRALQFWERSGRLI